MNKISLSVILVFLLSVAFLVAPVVAGNTVTVNAGDGQSATVGAAVATPPSVKVTNSSDSTPMSGESVTFAVASGGGSVTMGTTTTDANGIATVGSWILGTSAGSNTLTATSGSGSATFTATGTAGTATQIALNAGNGQSATINTAVTTLPSVIVKDSYGNPVSGTSVTFAGASGGGKATGLTTPTGSNGVATVGSWTLGATVGANTLTATSGSLSGSPITFTATATASSPAITSISPSSPTNSGSQTIVIIGSGFSGSSVTLTKTGQSTVTGAVIGTDNSTTLSRNFNLNGIASGTWNLVILNSDGGTVTGTITINSATSSTITSISPTYGTINTTVSTTITGTGFVVGSAIIRLYRSGNYISGSVNSGGTVTQLTGTFDLTQATPAVYDVCVLPDGTEASKICSQTFTILSSASAANGSIYVKASPSTSKIFLNSVFQGYTPMTLDNLTPTTYTVLIRSAGYNDYSESVTVTAGKTSSVVASLVLTPDVTTIMTTVPRTTVSTMKTTVKSTKNVPTPWPSATPTSPVSLFAIIGAAGVGLIILRKP